MRLLLRKVHQFDSPSLQRLPSKVGSISSLRRLSEFLVSVIIVPLLIRRNHLCSPPFFVNCWIFGSTFTNRPHRRFNTLTVNQNFHFRQENSLKRFSSGRSSCTSSDTNISSVRTGNWENLTVIQFLQHFELQNVFLYRVLLFFLFLLPF